MRSKTVSASASTRFQSIIGCAGWLALLISSRISLNAARPRGSCPVTIVKVCPLMAGPSVERFRQVELAEQPAGERVILRVRVDTVGHGAAVNAEAGGKAPLLHAG